MMDIWMYRIWDAVRANTDLYWNPAVQQWLVTDADTVRNIRQRGWCYDKTWVHCDGSTYFDVSDRFITTVCRGETGRVLEVCDRGLEGREYVIYFISLDWKYMKPYCYPGGTVYRRFLEERGELRFFDHAKETTE